MVLRFFICSVEKHFDLKYFLASSSIPSSLVLAAIFLLNFKKSSLLATTWHFLFSPVSVLSLPIAICHHFLASSFFGSSFAPVTACELSVETFKVFVSASELLFGSCLAAVSVLFLPIEICHHFFVLLTACAVSGASVFFISAVESLFN